MRFVRPALLAGAAALALAGTAGLAQARSLQSHLLTVQLPGGQMEQIRYTGDIAPQIVLLPGDGPLSIAPDAFAGGQSPFAIMDRISAEMDRQAQAMLREAAAMTQMPMLPGFGSLTPAALGSLPPGGESYRTVSTITGSGVCTRSVSVTYRGQGVQPQVVSHVSGDCGPASAQPVPAVQPQAPPHWQRGPLIEARTQPRPEPARPYAGLVRRVSY